MAASMLASAIQDQTNPLVAYGLLGVILVAVVVLFLTGKVVTGRELDRAILVNDRLGGENAELRQRLLDSTADRTLNTEALKETTKVLRDVVVVLEVKKAIS